MRPFSGEWSKKPSEITNSNQSMRFNRRFRSYGDKVVLKKHPFYGVFLIFLGF
ncbi:hypothetical protein ECP02989421_5057 [Escherichia coli P0298942.1]|nr:hypothetical protein ECP02989421_5057 [Escherichia coli P0298942.1]